MFDFHVSDLGTMQLPGTKYYWQNERAKCCVLVPDSSRDNPNSPVQVHFMQAEPSVKIFCTDTRNPDSAEIIATPGSVVVNTITVARRNGICTRPEKCGRILEAILTLIDQNSWSFPRAKATAPYIGAGQAALLEENFAIMAKSVDRGGSVYLTVDKAGTMLAERINLPQHGRIKASHYVTETNTQDESILSIQIETNNGLDIAGKEVIVIDDLISSGRTANAIIEALLQKDVLSVSFFALYRTICSREVTLIDKPNVLIQSYVPLSNAYWTYGRGFDLSDDESRNSSDIYASTKHWDWETPEDVNELIDEFGCTFHLGDYSLTR